MEKRWKSAKSPKRDRVSMCPGPADCELRDSINLPVFFGDPACRLFDDGSWFDVREAVGQVPSQKYTRNAHKPAQLANSGSKTLREHYFSQGIV